MHFAIRPGMSCWKETTNDYKEQYYIYRRKMDMKKRRNREKIQNDLFPQQKQNNTTEVVMSRIKQKFKYFYNIDMPFIDNSINVKETSIKNNNDIYSIVMPYMHNNERFVLMKHCLDSLSPLVCDEVEICVHEVGEEQNICKSMLPSYCKYMYTYYDGNFNRGWAINTAVRNMTTGKYLLLMDSDIIVSIDWIKELFKCKETAIAWNKIYYLNENNTNYYLENFIIKTDKCEKTRVPSLCGAAGGATFIPREIFYKVKGFPEVFEGWGGEDNVFISKLYHLGYEIKKFNNSLYHMYHKKNEIQADNLGDICNYLLAIYKKEQWINHIENLGDVWGQRNGVRSNNILENENNDEWGEDIRIIYNKNYEENNYEENNHEENNLKKLDNFMKLSKNKIKYIDRLCGMWDGFDRKSLTKIYSYEEPLVTIVMLSYIRYNKLMKTLDNFLKVVKVPMNIALRVQGDKYLDEDQIANIKNVVKKFKNNHISFTADNHGSGKPRWEMLQEALYMDTPYIMFTDDDMLFPKGSIEAKLSILDSIDDLGACASWCNPSYNAWDIIDNKLINRQPKIPFGYCDAMGSATTIMKREVFDTCDYDKDYYVGWGDFDLCMQLKANNWKCAILALNDLKALNNVKGDPTQYRSMRYNKQYAVNSAYRFYNKWGIKIGR